MAAGDGATPWFASVFGSGGLSVDLGDGRGGYIVRDPVTGVFNVNISTQQGGSPNARNAAGAARVTTPWPTWLPIAVVGVIVLLALGGLAGKVRA